MASKVKPRRWKTLESERVYETPILDLHRHHREHPARGRHDFFVLDAPNWCNIIPLTVKREVVMVRQYRHGIENFTLEIPGGMIDPEDRNPKLAARREMIEETGYDATNIVALGKVHPNPAIQANYCYSFVARGVRKVETPQFDTTEECEVVLVPLAQIKPLIVRGKISHALVIAAFSFLQLYGPSSLR